MDQWLGAVWQRAVAGLEIGFIGGVCGAGAQGDESHPTVSGMVVVGFGHRLCECDGGLGNVQTLTWMSFVWLRSLVPMACVV